MRWQFAVDEEAEEEISGRIVWMVDYKTTGLSRNSYFPPQDSRITAKVNIVNDHPESIVTIFKVRLLLKLMHFIRLKFGQIFVAKCLICQFKYLEECWSATFCDLANEIVISPLDETLNRGPWCCSCGDNTNFPLGLI